GTVASAPADDDDGDDVGGDGYAIRFESGTQPIMAIRLVRELTGLGLKEAKEIVDRRKLVRTGMSRIEANTLARAFAHVGAQVQVIEPGSSDRGRFAHDYEKEDDFDF
ncbi:MAG TPA: 50S ribosomal protein L7/L12, partial [Enhygromyxa sp.]|nr:50S ribosomal protein L7/L12 [Enhygromyxa sp.]